MALPRTKHWNQAELVRLTPGVMVERPFPLDIDALEGRARRWRLRSSQGRSLFIAASHAGARRRLHADRATQPPSPRSSSAIRQRPHLRCVKAATSLKIRDRFLRIMFTEPL